MYATIAILAALNHRHNTGKGQYIDLALLDTQVAWLTTVGLNYLTSGEVPGRMGNEHHNIVPYNVMPSSDGYFILAVGNDGQFAKFCAFAGEPGLAKDPRFATNEARLQNRKALYEILPGITRRKTREAWIEGLAKAGVPASPVNDVAQVFQDPQVQARGMKLTLPYPGAADAKVDLIANPIRFSETPIEYRMPPPTLGQHTEQVLKELLGLGPAEIADLRARGAI
jgi:crotonobetainyl-CoA:carnitine CoA-transferase CaiB-like acyl-CoA transferase